MRVRTLTVKTKAQAADAHALILGMIKTMGYREYQPKKATFITQLLNPKNNAAIVLAYLGQTPVGMANLSGYFIPYEAGMAGYYMALYVTPEHRNQGIADALFTGIRKEAKKRKYKGLFWQVHEENAASMSFFSKHGCETFKRRKPQANFYIPYTEL